MEYVFLVFDIRNLHFYRFYYYEGVASWTWFYPHHFAPQISDLAIFMEDFICAPFDFASPLKPLEQLMAVLPPASYKLVPKPLAWLMCGVDSPLKEFYPETFKTDANGKKASWEHIVLIPFIDSNLLLPALKSLYPQLDKEASCRNEFGISVSFKFHSADEQAFPLSAPSTEFPPLPACRVEVVEFKLPVLDFNQKFVATLCKGAMTGVRAMPGFPTLATLPLSGVLDSGVGLDVFGQAAKGYSLVLQLANPSMGIEAASKLIGKRVFVNWPHLQEGLVASVTDGCHRYEICPLTGSIIVKEANSAELQDFGRMATQLEREYKKRCAVMTGPVDVILWVRPFAGMLMAADGSTKKQYREAALPYALQTVVLHRLEEDVRYQERSALGVSSLYPLHSPVIYLGSDAYGSLGTVVGHEDSENSILVKLPKEILIEPALSNLVTNRIQSQTYYSSTEISRLSGISHLLLSKLTSPMILFIEGVMCRPANIGLGIKSEAKGLAALGLARKGIRGWEFEFKVKNLLMKLPLLFPDLLRKLERECSQGNFNAEALFEGTLTKKIVLEKIAPMQKFIKESLGIIVMVPIQGDFLDQTGILEISNEVEKFHSSNTNSDTWRTVKASAAHIISAATANSRLLKNGQRFTLGERVIHCGVPFGVVGTVVGIEHEQVDGRVWILLDKPAMGVGDFNGIVEEGRGLFCNPRDCLSLIFANKPIVQPSAPRVQTSNTRTENILSKPIPATILVKKISQSVEPEKSAEDPIKNLMKASIISKSKENELVLGRSIKVEDLFTSMSIQDQKDPSPKTTTKTETKPQTGMRYSTKKGSILKPNMQWGEQE